MTAYAANGVIPAQRRLEYAAATVTVGGLPSSGPMLTSLSTLCRVPMYIGIPGTCQMTEKGISVQQ